MATVAIELEAILDADTPPNDQNAKGGAGLSAEEKALRVQKRARMKAKAEAIAARGASLKQAPKPAPDHAVEKIVVYAPAPKAKMRKRHWGLIFSFIIFVIAPVSAAGWYLWERAAPRYVSYAAFSVRKEEVGSASDLLGNISALSGSSSSDTDILYNFIKSQELIRIIDAKLDLRAMWSKADPDVDPIFAYHAPGSIEQLTKYWKRMVKVYSDDGSGLIDMTVQAFTPDDATKIAALIYAESSEMINRLSTIAREDAIGYARDELDVAVNNLRDARKKITQFRNRTQIVDPSANIQSQMGLLASLQAQLADTLIDLDILRQTSTDTDPRIVTAQRRFDAISARIEDERKNLGFAGGSSDGEGSGYADIVDEYESLEIDLTFMEETYSVARAAYASSLAESRRQSRYLAAHVRPTTAETPEHPQRISLLALIGLIVFLFWTLLVLVSYAVKDRR